MSGRDRSMGPPGGTPPQRDPRRGVDSRNGSSGGQGDSTVSRAEKFEDEKRRIIQSCFTKKDSDGSLVESYITHVRIIEDGAYPSSPPPPNSSPENKKPRVIIVAVRRSGRVRMHKARENNDGTFSIGKTWMLDDLSAIQSFNAWVPSTPLEQQQKQWASNVGFVVTVGKPYYWHAKTSKEKEFFIGSLVKIYKKYTGGKMPDLIGFDEREHQLLLGAPPSTSHGAKSPSCPSVPEGSLPPPHPPSSSGNRPQSPHWARTRSRDGPKGRPAEEELPIRAQKSREHMRRPSTAQSGKSGPPPFAPPQHPPPVTPTEQGDLPPPRAIERLAADNRTPKSSPLSSLESRNKEIPSSLRTPSSALREKTRKELDEGNLSSPQTEPRPSSSRSGKSFPEPRPTLRSQNSSSSIPEARRAKDDIVPGLVPSDLQVKEPSKDSGVTLSTSPGQQGVSPGDQLSTSNMRPPAVPPALRPGTSASNNTAAKATETPQPVSEKRTESSEPLPETKQLSSPTSPPVSPKDGMEDEADAHRPGLGPMIKKKSNKDVAGAFRKAATAYGAFKPRPGGAGEKLLAAAKKQAASDEPDGITGVVPAPFLRKPNEPTNVHPEETTVEAPTAPAASTAAISPQGTAETRQPPPADILPEKEPPKVEVTESVAAVGGLPSSNGPVDELVTTAAGTEERPTSVSPSPRDRRRRRHEDNTFKYCQALGLDSKILGDHGLDFDDILTDLGWNGRLAEEKRIEDLEADVRREIGRVEATSWLGNLEQQEGKVDQLAKLIDKTIEECEELDNLLTLYSHELNTLRDDVSYIETQSQGLQVQTANQKLLQSELQNLLQTLSISAKAMQPLKEASLSNPDGLRETESALSTLYKAMLMIDPDIAHNKKRLDAAGDHGSAGVYADTEIGQMRAIKDKKEEYRFHCSLFLQRFKQTISIAYRVAEQKRVEAAANIEKDPMKLDGSARAHSRRELWVYNALTLFAREVSAPEWQELITLYEPQARHSYQAEFRDNNMMWKKAARKTSGEEQELLFTHQDKEKEAEGITTAARKLTVRRGKTIRAAANFRLSIGDKQHGKLEAYEVFSGTLQETIKMISEEQNFLVRFFHLTSLSNTDFADLVASGNPDERPLPDFTAKQSPDPDRAMARKVEQVMDELYSFWSVDMQNLVDWSLKADPLQGIGILFVLEKSISELDDTNQDFIIHSLQKLHSRLIGLFNRFVDEQIRGIEETKVKVNKRKGVISFMRVFPNFSAAVENMLSDPSQEFYDVRISVNEAYDRINRAMWESLKFIAKEAPGQSSAAAAGGSGDPEDKEVLNYHILLIENMNHYIEEVDVRNLPVLERWRDRAQQDLEEHMKLYLDSVIHRPLGRLIDFVDSVESLAATANPTDIASRPSHSRSVAKKVLAIYDAKEIKRGVEMLKKRVEKHFGDADDPGLSRSLVLKVLRECQGRYERVYDQTQRVLHTVYEGQLDLEWRKEDAIAMFRK